MNRLLEDIERALARADALGHVDAGIHLDRARLAVAKKVLDGTDLRESFREHPVLQ